MITKNTLHNYLAENQIEHILPHLEAKGLDIADIADWNSKAKNRRAELIAAGKQYTPNEWQQVAADHMANAKKILDLINSNFV